MQFIRKSFSRKLALTYGLLFLLVFIGTYFYSSKVIENRVTGQLEESLTVQAKLLRHILTPLLIETNDQSKLGELVRELGKAPYLRTHADGKWNNNLLAQPECGNSCKLL